MTLKGFKYWVLIIPFLGGILGLVSCSEVKSDPPKLDRLTQKNLEIRDSLLQDYLASPLPNPRPLYSEVVPADRQIAFGEVAPIFRKNCLPCHHKTGNAPFSLASYKAIKKRAPVIREVLEKRIMPPWSPDDSYSHFFNAPTINDSARACIIRWIDQGAQGSPGWDSLDFARKNLPDTVIWAPESHIIAGNEDTYQCFYIDLGFDTDRYIAGFEFRSENPEVVHHVAVYLDTLGGEMEKGKSWDCIDDQMEKFQLIGVWSRGKQPYLFDNGWVYRIPKGARMLVQAHYGQGNAGREDKLGLGLYFSEEPRRPVRFEMLFDLDLLIPADTVMPWSLTFPVEKDMSLLGLIPHLHFLGRKAECFALTPEGKKINLIHFKEWDYFFQGQYMFANPVKIPEGSSIFLNAIYDNTSGNPFQPNDPIRDVRFYHGANDEMLVLCLMYLDWKEGDTELITGHLIQ